MRQQQLARAERLEGDRTRSALSMMNGIPRSPAAGYAPVRRALIAHNSFVECKRTMVIGISESKTTIPPSDCLIINNAIASRRGPMIDILSNVSRFQWHANLCSGDGELGIEPSKGVRRTDQPLFQKRGSRWELFATSPLINAGQRNSDLPTIDYSSRARDDSPDIGCDEWPSKGPGESGLSVTVGPTWSPVDTSR